MHSDDLRKYGHEFIDWMADYLGNIEQYPVVSQVSHGDILKQLPDSPPSESESMDSIMNDFKEIILPGMTHWQNPSFHAYFPANNSVPSILAEMLTSTLGAQCMVWQTSPAAAELEEKVMDWLRDMLGLPSEFTGVIQDTASTATLVSILTAREKYTDWRINQSGFDNRKFRVYCSTEAHSSIEKAVKIAGIGKENLIKIPVDKNFAIIPEELEKAILNDIHDGFLPLCIVGAFGTTGSTAVDSIEQLGLISKSYNVWLHIDAAFAGNALILPEFRDMAKGIENADSFVMNPHKWLFTNFDCSAYFVKDKGALIRTFEIMPEYLKTQHDNVANNYRDWGIQLGRRFRALKLWFVIRSFGVNGLQTKLREHIKLAEYAENKLVESGKFEILAPRLFNVICFRFVPSVDFSNDELNTINSELLDYLNSTGSVYLTHTKLNEKYAIRLVIAQTNVEQKHIDKVLNLILNYVEKYRT